MMKLLFVILLAIILVGVGSYVVISEASEFDNQVYLPLVRTTNYDSPDDFRCWESIWKPPWCLVD